MKPPLQAVINALDGQNHPLRDYLSSFRQDREDYEKVKHIHGNCSSSKNGI